MTWTCPACGSDAVTRADITVLLVVLHCEDCHATFTFRRERPPPTSIEATARLVERLRMSVPGTRHQIAVARALVESTRELLQHLEAAKPSTTPHDS